MTNEMIKNHQKSERVEELFMRVTRPESRGFVPYSVPQDSGFSRMHQNESPLPAFARSHHDFVEELSGCLEHHWRGEVSGPNVYPSLAPFSLKSAYADYLGAPADQVEVFSGSSEALHVIASGCFRPGARVAFLDPSFSVLAELVQFWGAKHVPIQLDENFQVIEESLFSADVLNADVVILCTPNNPTGAVIPAGLIERFAGLAKGLVVIDEAYYEFAKEWNESHQNFVSLALKNANVLVLRTLSKAWGAAGLRVGALVGAEKWVAFFAGLRRPYSISQPSEILGTFVLQEKRDLMSQIVSEAVKNCKLIKSSLSLLPGVKVYDSWGNFILFETASAALVVKECFDHKILVRSFSLQRPSAAARGFLRVSPWTKLANDTFIEIVSRIHHR